MQFGQSLTAGMVRRAREGAAGEVATQWTLQYNLSRRLRMQFQVRGWCAVCALVAVVMFYVKKFTE